MTQEQLLKLPLWQYTGEQLLNLLDSRYKNNEEQKAEKAPPPPVKRWFVYGIAGLCELLKCSKATAHRIKNSGVISEAISQSGRKIIIDAQLALDLIQSSKGDGVCRK